MNNIQQQQVVLPNPRMHAEALRRMGRGPDTQLIHMTDSEIGALNGLSSLVFNEPLRINPETGLPEASIFKKLLPAVLSLGAAAFLGPVAAPLFGSGAFASGLGAGLAGFGGHIGGQLLSGTKFDDIAWGPALMSGVGSGISAGFSAPSGGEIVTAGVPASGAQANIMNPVTGNFSTAGGADIAQGNFETFGLGAGTPSTFHTPSATPALNAMAAGQVQTTPIDAASSLVGGSGPGGMRTLSEGWDYLTDDWKRTVLPLGAAVLSGEFDEPLPEAPESSKRRTFVPKDLIAERSRRDLDIDDDGEITQVDIAALVERGPPEGKGSRFFTPMSFREREASTGGLVGLQTGGGIKEAIQALTGGEGASVLPMLAGAVVDPTEEEEEKVGTMGYPIGAPGTPPGGGLGQAPPPQPFKIGGTAAASGVAVEDAFGEPIGEETDFATLEAALPGTAASSRTIAEQVNMLTKEGLPNPLDITPAQAITAGITSLGSFGAGPVMGLISAMIGQGVPNTVNALVNEFGVTPTEAAAMVASHNAQAQKDNVSLYGTWPEGRDESVAPPSVSAPPAPAFDIGFEEPSFVGSQSSLTGQDVGMTSPVGTTVDISMDPTGAPAPASALGADLSAPSLSATATPSAMASAMESADVGIAAATPGFDIGFAEPLGALPGLDMGAELGMVSPVDTPAAPAQAQSLQTSIPLDITKELDPITALAIAANSQSQSQDPNAFNAAASALVGFDVTNAEFSAIQEAEAVAGFGPGWDPAAPEGQIGWGVEGTMDEPSPFGGVAADFEDAAANAPDPDPDPGPGPGGGPGGDPYKQGGRLFLQAGGPTNPLSPSPQPGTLAGAGVTAGTPLPGAGGGIGAGPTTAPSPTADGDFFDLLSGATRSLGTAEQRLTEAAGTVGGISEDFTHPSERTSAGMGGKGSMSKGGRRLNTGGPVSAYATGGQPNLPYFEGRVRGSGDGMSDNIPFVIAGRQEGGNLGMQPAVLSPDEYVMPADVVAMLGNGSSTAGSNQLDQFINHFRMDKYGRPEQPPEMRGGLRSIG